MAALTAAGVIGLAAKFMPKMVIALENNGSSDAANQIKKEFKPDMQGACSVVDGATGSEMWIAPGATLPAGGSVTPAQTQYGPSTAFDRLLVPNGILTGSKKLVGGVDTLHANFQACANRMVRNSNRGIFRKSGYVALNTVAGAATTDTVKDISWCRRGQKYDVYDGLGSGASLIETITLTDYTYQPNGSGNYTITFSAAATGWAADDVYFAHGAYTDGMDSLEDVTGTATTFQNVTTTQAPSWQGIATTGVGALASADLGGISDAIKNASGAQYHFHACNSIALRNYEDLFTSNRRYQTGDKLDQYTLVPSFDGKPILTGSEISLEDWFLVNTDHVSVHEFKKLGPNTDGGENSGGELSATGLSQHPTLNSLEMRVSRELQLRVKSRNSSGRLSGITI